MSKLTAPISPHDHTQGKTNAPWTVVEYGDYQCPPCGEAHTVIKQLQKHFGDQLRFVFRNFPLEVHPHAQHAAEAAEFAAAHGKFWEMHELLFAHQANLKDAALLKLAVKLRLGSDHLVHALKESKYSARVKKDLDSGTASGVQGTPTFYINGKQYEGNLDLKSLIAGVEATTRLKSGM